MITLVSLEHVPAVWNHAVPLLRRAVDRAKMWSTDDVRARLLQGTAHMFVEWQADGKIDAAAVCEFQNYPLGGLWLRLWLMGAAKGYDQAAFQSEISEWAKRAGARGLELIGRKGWVREFPAAEIAGVILRLPFEETDNAG